MPIDPKNGDLTAGVAGAWSETVNAGPELLITGDAPAFSWMALPAAAAQTFVARQVVGFNASNKIVPADNDTVAAIGFIMYAPSGATTDGQLVSVTRQGVFNPDALVWDAGYATAEDKRLAFEGAPSPTSIILRAPQAMTV